MPLTNYRPRGDIKAHWEAANPILKQREMGIEWESEIGKGKAKIKFGNGTSAWNSLDYGIVDDITQKTIDSFVATSGNNALVEGDTMDVIAGKLNAQREYWNTLTGADRAQAFFDSLSGLSNDDFVGVMTWLNSKKLDANLVYNGTDSTNKSQALAAPVGKQLKELTDTNATAISTLNSNLTCGNVRGSLNDGTCAVGSETWYYKDISFNSPRETYPYIVSGYQAGAEAQYGKTRCFVANVSVNGFRLVFESNSGNSWYSWAIIK